MCIHIMQLWSTTAKLQLSILCAEGYSYRFGKIQTINCLKLRAHGYQQILSFLLADALPVRSCLWACLPSVLSLVMKSTLCWVEIR